MVDVTFDDGVAVLTIEMEGRANKINETFLRGLAAALDEVEGTDGLAGIVLASGHRDFCVGADLDMIYEERDPGRIYEACTAFHLLHRRLEKGGVPVVAALTGSALGGGYELALACHHRIALDDGRVQIGLPEVMLGVIPGGGGTQRLPRMLGYQAALEIIAQGKVVRAPKAKAMGLVDDLQPTPAAVLDAAKAWCRANPKAKQPWDLPGFRFPPPRPNSPDARNLLLAAAAMTYKKTAGAFPAAEAAISAVAEGSVVTFDAALQIEARHFARLAVSDGAKDMIRTLFFHKQAADKQEGLPRVEDPGVRRVAILGAGMMGAGLAFVCAKAGYEVVLKDVGAEALERGMEHVREQIAKRCRHVPEEEQRAILGRVTASLELEALAGCDLVIEAVFEDLALKHRVTKEVEPLLAEGAIFASNTSAIPITDLAKASAHPDRFIGLHFFSPVEQMPLLEVIRGEGTSDETLARSLAFARRIKKTVIVVNDGYGFYTSRVFSAYIMEGAQLVAEGHDPVVIEWAARTAGMVVPPLQVFDEVTLKLGKHALSQALAYRGQDASESPAVQLVFAMVDAHGRLGKAHGAGFYDYRDGKRKGLWSGLGALAQGRVEPGSPEASVEAIAERLMLAQVAEVGRALDEGILRSYRDAEVGAVLGIGFAPNTGGPLAYIDRRGVAGTVARLDELAARHGERFTPAPVLRAMAERGERFF